jgi:hypothetical protein
MNTESGLSSWIHLLEPRTWLVVISMSLLLAVGSGWVLIARPSGAVTEWPVQAFDSLERFIRDTIRLSFTSKMKKSVISDDVFVAPKGILSKETNFQWLDDSQDIEARLEGEKAPPTAPPRLLDSQWQPDFPGLPE